MSTSPADKNLCPPGSPVCSSLGSEILKKVSSKAAGGLSSGTLTNVPQITSLVWSRLCATGLVRPVAGGEARNTLVEYAR